MEISVRLTLDAGSTEASPEWFRQVLANALEYSTALEALNTALEDRGWQLSHPRVSIISDS